MHINSVAGTVFTKDASHESLQWSDWLAEGPAHGKTEKPELLSFSEEISQRWQQQYSKCDVKKEAKANNFNSEMSVNNL